MAVSKRNTDGRPKNWEISIIKAMIEKFPKTEMSNQDILAYFSRPNRSLNSRVMSEIRANKEYAAKVRKASESTLDEFLKTWPQVDSKTGLSLIDDELVIKSREAMLLAVQAYNNPTTYFRSEVFIVLSIIAWTYLFHAFYKKSSIDYRERRTKDGKEVIKKTNFGAERYWSLAECLEHPKSFLQTSAKENLLFLCSIRDEVEHRMTKRIDQEFSSKFQACCLHYNSAIKDIFGEKLGLDSDLAIALQFSGFNTRQVKTLLAEKNLPANIQAAWQDFDTKYPENSTEDAMEIGFFFKKKIVNHESQADEVFEFIKVGGETSPDESSSENVYIKYTEPKKYRRKDILKIIHAEGFTWFGPHQHTELVQTLDAKNPKNGYGTLVLGNAWGWYDKWLQTVRAHCSASRPVIS